MKLSLIGPRPFEIVGIPFAVHWEDHADLAALVVNDLKKLVQGYALESGPTRKTVANFST